jgi:hypothetical protein
MRGFVWAVAVVFRALVCIVRDLEKRARLHLG